MYPSDLRSREDQLEAVNRFFEELASGGNSLRYTEENEMELAA